MLHYDLLLFLGLLFTVIMLVMLAQKINIAYPIFLVLGGLAIGLISGLPKLDLNPDFVFLIFMPPLLYAAAWETAWKEFWKYRRAIGLLAFGLVFFTSTAVAYFSASYIPGFSLSLGFLLGGIISPPDAVAASSVLQNMKVPRRLMTILEGESLINDASSLIVVRFALAAVVTGAFSFQQASGEFFLVAGMGIIIGILGAIVVFMIHKFLPTTPTIDATLTVMTPYFLYLLSEELEFSGVMAVVSGGLFISYRSQKVFQTGQTRLNMQGVWSTLLFVINAIVFVIIGLELPSILNDLGNYSMSEAIKYGLIISCITIVLRFIWIFPAVYIPRLLSRKIRKESFLGWKVPFVSSWSGMRGVVSLATALSIPLLINGEAGKEFPLRNVIIFITFVVILVTLVFQGLTLPLLLKILKIEEIDELVSEEEQKAGIYLHLKKAALKLLNTKYSKELEENELVSILKENIEEDIKNTHERLESLECDEGEKHKVEVYNSILLDIYALQRKKLFYLRKHNSFSDEEIRKAEWQIDLDEVKITGL